MADSALTIEYGTHDGVRRTIDVLRYCLEGISLEFGRWDEPHVIGPGLYVAVVAGPSIEEYADPMGGECWPVETCPEIDDLDAVHAAASEVATHGDGAVVVGVDGVVEERMVRFRAPASDPDDSPYADWMGSRHMSALDTSCRSDVVAALTLSAEDGRVTVFRDGAYDSATRDEFACRWRDCTDE